MVFAGREDATAILVENDRVNRARMATHNCLRPNVTHGTVKSGIGFGGKRFSFRISSGHRLIGF
jgi:hypothetical protein